MKFLFPALIALLAWVPLAPAQSTTSSPKAGTGRIVEAPKNIARFAPEETIEAIDASRVNVRQVLEDLGPVAMLWYQHVITLADPFFEGRIATTRGMELAGEYIAFHLAANGLDPAFPENEADDEWTSYFQPFEFSVRQGSRRATVENPHLSISGRELTFEKDYVYFGNSGSGSATAPITFVGYGIVKGENGYSSFADDDDLSGRIALVLRYEPLDEAGRSRWSEEGLSRHSSMRRKLKALKKMGAVGILVVNPPGAAHGRKGLDTLEQSSKFGRSLGIPIAQLDPKIVDDLLIQSDGKTRDLMTLRKLADRGEIKAFDLDDDYQVTMEATLSEGIPSRSIACRNCGGVLRGRGELAHQWLIIGGHYDHVGRGQLSGAMPNNRGRLHPGADDNASGTAGVLVLSKLFAEAYAAAPADADLRSILFMTFDAEEQGLRGSRHYSDHPTLDPDTVTVMVNFDMIGNLRADSLLILGSQTAQGLEELLEPHIVASGLTVALSPASSGRSDEANFIRLEIPGLHFFTGMSPEYHKPSDKAFTVNPGGAATVLALAYDLTMELATRPEQLQFTKPGQQRTASRGYGKVRFGIRPGMGDDLETGILVEGVSLDTSAHKAGIQEGDILLSWDGDELESIRNLFEKLQQHKPGDIVKIELQRGDEIIELDVTLMANKGED